MKYWETKEGKGIPYKKLEDSHLLNILKWIERRAESGIIITCGSCDGDGPDDWWGDEWEIIKGDEVLEKYDYKGLLKEAKKRKLKLK